MTTPSHLAGFAFGLILGACCIAYGASTPPPSTSLPPTQTLTHYPGP